MASYHFKMVNENARVGKAIHHINLFYHISEDYSHDIVFSNIAIIINFLQVYKI
jgi:hypothetical protein